MSPSARYRRIPLGKFLRSNVSFHPYHYNNFCSSFENSFVKPSHQLNNSSNKTRKKRLTSFAFEGKKECAVNFGRVLSQILCQAAAGGWWDKISKFASEGSVEEWGQRKFLDEKNVRGLFSIRATGIAFWYLGDELFIGNFSSTFTKFDDFRRATTSWWILQAGMLVQNW